MDNVLLSKYSHFRDSMSRDDFLCHLPLSSRPWPASSPYFCMQHIIGKGVNPVKSNLFAPTLIIILITGVTPSSSPSWSYFCVRHMQKVPASSFQSGIPTGHHGPPSFLNIIAVIITVCAVEIVITIDIFCIQSKICSYWLAEFLFLPDLLLKYHRRSNKTWLVSKYTKL